MIANPMENNTIDAASRSKIMAKYRNKMHHATDTSERRGRASMVGSWF